jgi:hypothetical protein
VGLVLAFVLWENQGKQRCARAEIPLENLGSAEAPGDRAPNLGFELQKTERTSLRESEGRSLMGPQRPHWQAVAGDSSGWLSCQCSTIHASLKHGLSSHLPCVAS